MKKLKLVMVGNGMAGVRTLEELLKLAPDLYDITVFGAEPHPNYNRILLSPVLAGEQTLDEIILNPLSWYEANGITLHLGRKAAEMDHLQRVLDTFEEFCTVSQSIKTGVDVQVAVHDADGVKIK